MRPTKPARIVQSGILPGMVVALLCALLSLASCGGGGGGGTAGSNALTHTTPAQPTLTTIANVDAAAVATPYLCGSGCMGGPSGNIEYYCSAPSGTGDGSSPANASGAGLDAAMAWVTGGVHRTLALCQGGSFTTSRTTSVTYTLTGNSCPIGTYCNEIREYPLGGNGPKPTITAPTMSTPNILFETDQSVTNGGWRFMNLKLQGFHDSTNGNEAFLFFNFVSGTYVHDILIENVDMDGFDMIVNDANDSPVRNDDITFIGNHLTNFSSQGYLGGATNLTVSYNSFINDANNTVFSHDIYVGTHLVATHDVAIVGNYASGFSSVSGATQCLGTVFQSHGAITNFVVSGNVVIEAPTAAPTCYAFEFSNVTSAVGTIYIRNALFSDNIAVNGGATSFTVDNCPYCVIENNLIIKDSTNFGGTGIASPGDAARPSHGDDVETNAKIVNNTVYFGTRNVNGMGAGIKVGQEGTGYIVANNTVLYAATSDGSNQVNCFGYWLPPSSYQVINNNNCYSYDPTVAWVSNNVSPYTLAAWQTVTAFDGHSTYADPVWPFTTPLTIPTWSDGTTGPQLFAAYFTPSGAPLVGTGNATNAPALDTLGNPRPNPPSIGAYQ